MSDIALILENNCFDLGITEDDLTRDDGLETSVSISLFTDRRVTEEELPAFETDKRGWWGDMFSEVDQDQIGSRLWTIARAKITNETLRRAEELCKEALDWMKEDGLADEIKVNSEYNDNKDRIDNIDIYRPDGQIERFASIWDKQKLRRL